MMQETLLIVSHNVSVVFSTRLLFSDYITYCGTLQNVDANLRHSLRRRGLVFGH